jgi:NO-binding membrane sensor protein with MHYT domain
VPHAAGHVHHFAMGSWLLFFAYLVSVVGSVIGLACTLQARQGDGTPRIGWLAAAAVSIGGVGIWLMHFIAMLGFDTPGSPVRYDIGRTAISAVLSIAAVFLGLVVFGVRTRFSVWRLLIGGLIMGLAVNLMHYTGMWAVQVQGTISYNAGFVWLSIFIAIVAATAALWFTVLFDSVALRIVAGLVMGIAVTGMHYTGMAAVEVNIDPSAPAPDGAEVFTFLFPVFVLAVVALAIPIYAVLMASTWSDSDAPPDDSEEEQVPEPRAATRAPRHAADVMGQGVRGVSNLAGQYTDPRRGDAGRGAADPRHSDADPRRGDADLRRGDADLRRGASAEPRNGAPATPRRGSRPSVRTRRPSRR